MIGLGAMRRPTESYSDADRGGEVIGRAAGSLEGMTLVTTRTPVSGIIATKEDVEAFRESCVFLRSQWLHFTTLFRGSDLKRELLQSIAPIFFSDLHQLLMEHLVLQIAA